MYNKTISVKIDKNLGYAYFMDKEHPLSSRIGRVYYHRHAMSMHLGRWLSKAEIVHHLDGNRANNGIDNLAVMTREAHTAKHSTKRGTEYCLVCGRVSKTKTRKYCSKECYLVSIRNTDKPDMAQLSEDIKSLNWCAIGRKYGVSDNAVRKWARAYKLL